MWRPTSGISAISAICLARASNVYINRVTVSSIAYTTAPKPHPSVYCHWRCRMPYSLALRDHSANFDGIHGPLPRLPKSTRLNSRRLLSLNRSR
jgi:hypothetical protein